MRKVFEDMPENFEISKEKWLGGRPDLLLDNEDDEMDHEMGSEDH